MKIEQIGNALLICGDNTEFHIAHLHGYDLDLNDLADMFI